MRDDANGARRQKRSAATESEAAVDGLAIRQAFLRHLDEQQVQAGFAAMARASATPPREKPRGRGKR